MADDNINLVGNLSSTSTMTGFLSSEFLRGFSAYEIAVQNGYTGTVEEWLLSLVGPEGPQGEKGNTGAQGPTGPAGNGIRSVRLNPDYSLTINYTNGTSFNVGNIRGEQGPQGIQGIQGIKGDTGATGPKGQKGDQGDKGDPGEPAFNPKVRVVQTSNGAMIYVTDINGTTYAQIVHGQKGEKGDRGLKGDTGPQGPKGDPGESFTIHICSQTEYDSTTRVPTIQNPDESVLYLVPSADQAATDLFVEWMYIDSHWERFGSATVDVSTKADKVENAVEGNFAGLDENGNLVDSGHKHSDYLTEHQSITGKADKVPGAVSGNFASLDGNGNLIDSGHKSSDYLTTHQDISGKADKVSGAVSGNFASLDGNGNLTDSGHKPSDYLTAHQDISGKADKAQNATSGNFASLDGNGNLVDSGHKSSDYLTAHQDISGKADKVQNATSGNFASLDGNGNLVDSGKKPSDYLTAHQDISSKADKVQNATNGNFASLDSNGNLVDSGKKPSDYLTDVQINDSSVVTNGVAEIPVAGVGQFGVVQITAGAGGGININPSGGLLTYKAPTSEIKGGTTNYKPIVPSNQHESTFYGLAKAAGDTSQSSSSNTVGTYTDDAKIAIQKMLGIYQTPWELIREDTFTNETEADHFITVDGNGLPFDLTDIIVLFETPTQNTDAAKGKYGQIHIYRYGQSNSPYIQLESGAWTQTAGSSPKGCAAVVEQKDGLLFSQSVASTATSNGAAVRYRYSQGYTTASNGIFMPGFIVIFNKVGIPSVTGTGHYKIYGKRKWQ